MWSYTSLLCLLAVHCAPQSGAGIESSTVRVESPATAPTLTLDGDLDDWGFSAQIEDPSGDGSETGLDLGRLWVTDEDGGLFFRLDTGRETVIQRVAAEQAGADLTLHLDMNASRETGFPLSGMGVDLSVYYGRRMALRYDGERVEWLSMNDIGSQAMPTHSGTSHEFRLPLNTGGVNVQTDVVRFIVTDGAWGDRLPDAGYAELKLRHHPPRPVEPVPLERPDPDHVRVLVHNTLFNGAVERPAPFRRYLGALAPDLILFQEVWDWPEAAAESFVGGVLPLHDGGAWSAAKSDDTMVVSRWPIVERASVADNVVVLVRLPPARGGDLVLMSVHTPCCDNDEGRDRQHQQLAAAWRDLLAGEGPFVIDPATPMIMAGDFNMVGLRRQRDVLQEGRFFDDEFGADFAPARAAGALAAVQFRHNYSRAVYTWRDDAQEYTPGRLDYLFYTPDAAAVSRAFALWTPDFPVDALASFLLERDDSLLASDHLVLVTDFDFRR
ncbi:MAG TPA: endonuclease/exonuclease/phosphatase family protein [Acidobacteriota bacterium]|nr:endonuclease/exonuclease/phosphatase family protein [Acidobacteriota bacterium]